MIFQAKTRKKKVTITSVFTEFARTSYDPKSNISVLNIRVTVKIFLRMGILKIRLKKKLQRIKLKWGHFAPTLRAAGNNRPLDDELKLEFKPGKTRICHVLVTLLPSSGLYLTVDSRKLFASMVFLQVRIIYSIYFTSLPSWRNETKSVFMKTISKFTLIIHNEYK